MSMLQPQFRPSAEAEISPRRMADAIQQGRLDLREHLDPNDPAQQRLAGLLLGQLLGGQLALLVVDQREEFLHGPEVALIDGREDAGDLVHAGCSPGPSGHVAARTDAGATTLRTDSDEADPGAEVRPPG